MRIGPWRLEERLGRGGMGDVWRARRADGAYDEVVALKTVRTGMDAPELVARFEAERHILARLAHPHIARLLDGGVSEDGRPYLVMDYVEGAPITAYAEQRALPVAARLALFLDVCDAVLYAHRNLVVHRDIKPSNILVTRDGHVVLLDFGIAKLLDPGPDSTEGTTRTQARLLTPEFASPEQQRGDPVTTASDVYMLGVVLRELLTGSRDAPPRATRSAPKLRGDLDVIVHAATQPDPARRYGSVEPLADDIRRYLAGLPIRARADSWAYRARKFARRHRFGVAIAALLVLALAADVAASMWQAARAEQNFADARALANAMVFDVHDAIADLPGSTPARRLLVERALQYLDRLSTRAQQDTSLKIELAKAYIKTGSVLGIPTGPNLGDRTGALAAFGKADAVLRSLGPAADSRAARETEWSLEYGYATIQYWASRYDVARAHRERATAIAERLLAETPADIESRRRIATLEVLAGDIEFWGGTLDHAVSHYRAAVDAASAAAAAAPGDVRIRLQLGVALTQLGESLDWAERWDESESVLRRASELLDALRAKEAASGHVANSALMARVRWAALLNERNRHREALAVVGPAVTTGEDLLRADPRNTQAQNNLAVAYSTACDAHRELQEPDAARTTCAAALALRRRQLAVDPSTPESRRAVATSLAQLADVERSQRRFEPSLEYYRQSIELLRTLRADVPDDPAIDRDLATWLTSAGSVERRAHPERARAVFAEAAALWDGLEKNGQLKPYDRENATLARNGAKSR